MMPMLNGIMAAVLLKIILVRMGNWVVIVMVLARDARHVSFFGEVVTRASLVAMVTGLQELFPSEVANASHENKEGEEDEDADDT